MKRFAAVSIAVIAGLAALAPAASGSGGPPIATSVGGVTAPGGKVVIDAIQSRGGTSVLRISRRSDRVVGYRSLPLADLGVPAIGLYHPTPAGLSGDGRTLVLQRGYGGGQKPTSAFAVVDAKALRLDRVVRLHGVFGFDGLSPNGRRLYLVEYPSPLRDPGHYLVRAYDLQAGRLAPKPIVDPSDDEQMRGLPVMRATSPSGRWAYTLYTGVAQGKPPFVHALDLGRGRAKCIDLPRTIGAAYNDRLRVAPDGRTLTVWSKHGVKLASVDTRTFDVSNPTTQDDTVGDTGGGGGISAWFLIALGAGLAIAALSLIGLPRLHRRRLADDGS